LEGYFDGEFFLIFYPFDIGVNKRLEFLHPVEYGFELHPVSFLFVVFAKNNPIDKKVVQGAFR